MPKRTRTLGNAKRASYKRPPKRTKFATRSMMRASRKSSLNVHRFSRYSASLTLTAAAAAVETALAQAFTLADIINVGEFTALFDRYRIDKIVYRIQLLNNPDTGSYLGNPVANNNNNFYPKIWWTKDYDDAVAENISSLQQRIGVKCKVLQPNKVHTMVIRPAILAQTYRTAVTTGYAPKFNTFIDMTNTDVPHYGLKYCVDFNGIPAVAASLWQFRIDKQYYFTCKDVR